jgi:hypothetical protein
VERLHIALTVKTPGIISVWDCVRKFPHIVDARVFFDGTFYVMITAEGDSLASPGKTIFRRVAKLSGIIAMKFIPSLPVCQRPVALTNNLR